MRTLILVCCLSFMVSCYKSLPKPGTEFAEISRDGAWCWFQDPRAVHVDGKTITNWVTADGELQIGSFDHYRADVQQVTLKENWNHDDHNVGSILVLPDNRLMVFYAQHNKTGLFCRTSLKPADISEWGEEITVSGTDRITYSHPVYLKSENKYYVFWRGPSWKPTLSTSTDGITWSEPQILVQQRGKEAQGVRPYLKVVSDGDSTIHFSFTDGHPRNEPQNSVYYMQYGNGVFSTIQGDSIGDLQSVPISPPDCDMVYDASETNVRAWVWDIALDAGNPVITYTRLPRETDHRYHYAAWDGETWQDHEICTAGPWFPQTPEGDSEREPHYSGGIAINQSRPGTVYVSRRVEGQFEIERWSTDDKGANWERQPITQNSQMLNVRPVFPHGFEREADMVLWMHGEYVHYTNYSTDIRMHVIP